MAGFQRARSDEQREVRRRAILDAAAAMLLTGATWAAGQPSAAMVAAYEADPELAGLRLDVEPTLRELFAVLLAGLLVR